MVVILKEACAQPWIGLDVFYGNKLILQGEPAEAFRHLKDAFVGLPTGEPLFVKVEGRLGKSRTFVRIRRDSQIAELWESWYTQAVQAKAATIGQKIVFPR